MDLRCDTLVCFFCPSQQQQPQEAEEVLVPHQELPNGAQPMEGSIGPFLLENVSCHCVLCVISYGLLATSFFFFFDC